MAGKEATDAKEIYDYAKNGRNVDGIQHLAVQERANLEWVDKAGYTPLIIACIKGDNKGSRKNIAEKLVEFGANVNHRGKNGWTPLHHAVENGHEDVVKLLLKNGANALAMTDDGLDALKIAQSKGLTAIIHLLEESQPKHSPTIRGTAPKPSSTRGSAIPTPSSTHGSVTQKPSGNDTRQPSSSSGVAFSVGKFSRDLYDGFMAKGSLTQNPENESKTTNITLNSNNSSVQVNIGSVGHQSKTQPSVAIKETKSQASSSGKKGTKKT